MIEVIGLLFCGYVLVQGIVTIARCEAGGDLCSVSCGWAVQFAAFLLIVGSLVAAWMLWQAGESVTRFIASSP